MDLDAGTLSVRSRRAIALPPIAVEVLRKHRKEQARLRLAVGKLCVDQGLVFTDEADSPIDPDTVSKAMRRLARKADLSDRFTFHDLRHSRANTLLKASVGPRVVSDRLGHSAASFTLATHGHVPEGQDRRAAEQVEALRGGPGARP